jgi:ubiquinone/menaquinone biosynthesis C-methylase UbiE
MQKLKKHSNFLSEEHFHDQWAKSVSIDDIDVLAQFQGFTSPEYQAVMRALPETSNKKILNLGCGLGEEAVYLALSGANVTAIDISQEMLNITKQLATRYGVKKKITYYKMSAEDLQFTNNTFDAVVGCNILHHIHIEKTIKEIKRVLKPHGVAVFSEPLIYNPIINIYRVLADKVRTDEEHPLSMEDIAQIKAVFPKTTHREYHLLTLFIFIWFYLVERQHPNKVRYWKKIISEADKYKLAFNYLYALDRKLLWLLPFLRKYCWVSVITAKKYD